MREIRTFELDQRDVPTGWYIDRPQTLKVIRGELWLTVEGDNADFWLRPGDVMQLQRGATIWVGASEAEGEFKLIGESHMSAVRVAFGGLVGCVRRVMGERGATTA